MAIFVPFSSYGNDPCERSQMPAGQLLIIWCERLRARRAGPREEAHTHFRIHDSRHCERSQAQHLRTLAVWCSWRATRKLRQAGRYGWMPVTPVRQWRSRCGPGIGLLQGGSCPLSNLCLRNTTVPRFFWGSGSVRKVHRWVHVHNRALQRTAQRRLHFHLHCERPQARNDDGRLLGVARPIGVASQSGLVAGQANTVQ